MRKRWIALLGAMVLILSALTGCGAAPGAGEPDGNAGAADADSAPADVSYTAEELKPVMAGLLKSAAVAWGYFTCGACPYDRESPAPGKEFYYLVTAPGLRTMEDLKAFAYETYTPECAQRNFFAYIGDDVEYSHFLEINGRLYTLEAGKGWPYEYTADSLQLLRQEGDAVTVSVDRLCFEQPEGKSVFVLKKTAQGWRFDNSFTESATEEYLKFLNP